MSTRTEHEVAAEFEAADVEHTEACKRAKETAEKRGALLRELQTLRAAKAAAAPEPQPTADKVKRGQRG